MRGALVAAQFGPIERREGGTRDRPRCGSGAAQQAAAPVSRVLSRIGWRGRVFPRSVERLEDCPLFDDLVSGERDP